MKNLKWYFYLVATILFFVGIGYLRLSSTKSSVTALNRGGVRTYGKVTNKYKGIDYSYFVNGNLIERGQRTKPRGVLDGEIFEVIYDKNSPKESIINFHKPFIDSIKYDTVCTSSFNPVGNNNLLKLKYTYRGRSYERYHMADLSNYENEGPYKVLVNRNRPEQSYMIDKSCSSNGQL